MFHTGVPVCYEGPNMSSLVVLVTGGSGFLGQHVIKHLQLYADFVKEIRILDLVSYEKKLDFEATKPVHSHVGSITDQTVVNEACQDVDVVLHLASIIDNRMFPNTELFREINVKGTETVLKACKQQNVPFLLYCSSIATVQGYDEVHAGTETSVKIPQKLMFPDYGSTKYEAQSIVLKANGYKLNNGKTLQTLAILPLTMYGELDTNLGPSIKSFRGKTFPRFGPTKAYVQFAYVGNVAMMFVKALDALRNNSDLGGEYFFGADDTPATTITDFLKPFLDSIDGRISSWHVPLWFVYFCIMLIYIVLLVIRPIKKVNTSIIASGMAHINTTFYVTYDKANTLLGYKPLYDYEKSIENSIEYYSID